MRALVFTLLLVAVLLFASSQHSGHSTPSVNTPIPAWQLNLNYKQYKQSKSLLKNNLYDIYWNIDDETETLYMALSVKTTGWVGIGFSPNGFMPESDLIIGWVNPQGKAFVDDYYADGRSPQKDVTRGGTADVKLVGGKEVDGRTIIEFKRQLATADVNDFVIAHEEMRVIIAFRDGTDRPEPNDDGTGLAQHTYTGSFKIQFYQHAMGPAYPETDTESLIIKMANHSLDTSKRTNYICQKFSLPELMNVEKDFHIVEYRALIDNPNVVHHMIIYECDAEPVNLPSGPYDCLKKSSAGCYRMMAAWGIGAVPTFTLPNEAGFRISGGESQYLRGVKHFRLEVHYDYPYNYTQTILDSSGFEIIYTPSIRKHDAGVLTAGYAMNKISIPPGTAEKTFTGYCNHDCTDRMVEPVKIIAYMLHMHLAGRKMWTYLFRNSTIGLSREDRLKQAIRMEKLDYDFARQEQVAFTPALDLYPGDELETSCVYNTEDRTAVTRGGYSTYDEMCFNFIVFYPRERSFAFCYNGYCEPYSETMGKKRVIQTTSEEKSKEHYILQNAESIGIIVAICIVTVLAIAGIMAVVAGSKVLAARFFPQPIRPQQA